MRITIQYESFVRRGNHFIRLHRVGWTLIDGPWHKTLDRIRLVTPHCTAVQTSYLDFDQAGYNQAPESPVFLDSITLIWLLVVWSPGVPMERPDYTDYEYWKWLELHNKRFKIGFSLEDGSLPAYMNYKPFITDEEKHDRQIERGY